MPDRSEWYFGLPESFDPNEGDTLYGYSEGWDGEVAFTRFGEFGVEISEMGELIATFPDQGLMYIYEQEGPILMALVDVGKYLGSLPIDKVATMPNGGFSVIGLLEHLRAEKLAMMLTITFGELNRFNVVVMDENGEQQVAKDVDGVDFTKGITGDLGIKEHSISFEVTRYGDDLFMAFGERKGKKASMVSVESSLFVDFEDDVFGEDHGRLQKLARKIILN